MLRLGLIIAAVEPLEGDGRPKPDGRSWDVECRRLGPLIASRRAEHTKRQGIIYADHKKGLLVGLSAPFAEPLSLVHVEIPPDDEVPRILRSHLFLEDLGRRKECTGTRQRGLIARRRDRGTPTD